MRTSLIVVIALSFSAITAAGRQKQAYSHTSKAAQSVPALKAIPYTALQKICQGAVVGDFQNFFNSWIIQNLLARPFAPPSQIVTGIKSDVDGHLAIIQAYAKDFLEKSGDLAKYAHLYFDVEVQDLVTRVNNILKVAYQNPFDNPDHIDSLTPALGPYAGSVADTVAEGEPDRVDLDNIGSIFRGEDLARDRQIDPALRAIIEGHKLAIIPALKKIIRVFAETDGPAEFKALDKPTKEFLQIFFDNFKYLLTPEEHRATVLEALTKQPAELAVKEHPFVTPALLDELASVPSEYKPYLYRDRFLVSFDPEYRLQELNDAATDAFFSWDFFKAFDDTNFGTFLNKQDKSPEAKKARKYARTHVLIYKIYTIARDDRTLLPADEKDKVAVLRKLFRWVIDTKNFDAPTEEEGAVLNPGKKPQALLPADKFKRYFLPVASTICAKIPGCSLLKDDKKPILDKFIAFGNIEELKAKPSVASLIKEEDLKVLRSDAIEEVVKDFAKDFDPTLGYDDVDDGELDDDLQDYARDADGQTPYGLVSPKFNPIRAVDDEDSEEEEGKPSPKKDKTPLDLVPQKSKDLPLALGTPEIKAIGKRPLKKKDLSKEAQMQDDFNEKVGSKLLPTADEPVEQKKAELARFIDTIESTDNPLKKNRMRKLLIKFIHQTYKEKEALGGDNPVKPLADQAIAHLAKKLRAEIDYKLTDSFRNFLFQTMNGPATYKPDNANDEYTMFLDVLFFIKLAIKDQLIALQKQYGKTSKEFALGAQIAKEQLEALNKGYTNVDSPWFSLRKSLLTPETPLGPEFLERASGVEFMRHFIDFFGYYERNIKKEAKAVNAPYHRVYVQFYQILSHLRRGAVSASDNPHEFVLRKIEECMEVTDSQETFVEVANLRGHCVFSYRKYAEVLFFYKMYLLHAKKPVKLTFEGSTGHRFNVHTRIFLVFASENQDYSHLLNLNCEIMPKEAICISWRLYNDLLTFMRSPQVTYAAFEQQLAKYGEVEGADNRINLFNGVEAAYFHNQAANMVDFSKFVRLFDVEDVDTASGLGKALQFVKGDEKKLARYLSRTFKKLELSAVEQNVAKFVYRVLQGPESLDHDKDSLATFLWYNGRLVPFHLKVFLQYATKDAHFERIARLLVNYGISSNLVTLNEMKKDSFFAGLVNQLAETKEADQERFVYNILQAEYKKTLKECRTVTSNSVLNQLAGEQSVLDMLGGLDLEEEEEEVQVAKEHKQAEVVIDKIHETVVEVKVRENDDAQLILEKARQNILTSKYGNNFDVELVGDLKELSESGSVVFEEDIVEDFEDEEEEGEDGKQHSVEGVSVSTAKEAEIIRRAEEMANKIGTTLMAQMNDLLANDEALSKIHLELANDTKLDVPASVKDFKRILAKRALQDKLREARQKRQRLGIRRTSGNTRAANRQRALDRKAESKAKQNKEHFEQRHNAKKLI